MVAGLDGSLSVAEFQQLLAEKTGVPAPEQELLAGFPPAAIKLPADTSASTLSSLPVANGDTIVVRRREGVPSAAIAVPETATAVTPLNQVRLGFHDLKGSFQTVVYWQAALIVLPVGFSNAARSECLT